LRKNAERHRRRKDGTQASHKPRIRYRASRAFWASSLLRRLPGEIQQRAKCPLIRNGELG
jgi:hypothetical protein